MENEEVIWKGTHISEFQTSLNLPQYPDVVNSDEHLVLVQTPFVPGKVPDCFPSIFDKVDYWDGNHVKLPCSEKNVTEDQINRWNLIREALSSVILSSQQLEAAILSYNKRFAERWNFATLRVFFDEVCQEEESSIFFQSLLPKIVELALLLPELITGGVPLLKRSRKYSVTLSQLQIASLLANAFFCTFPHRNSYAKGCEYANYPTINFTRLFQAVFRDRKNATYEKLRCILHYFRRVTSSAPTGVVTFSRNFIPNMLIPNWSESSKKLQKLYVSSEGTIEDAGFGLFQLDFAHKLVGGGVIGNGCVQEEIRFMICPELILSRLFTECLEDNEALIVIGCERFSNYKGYGKSFEWSGDCVDETPYDEHGRKYCTVVGIDALFFKRNPKEQFSAVKVDRELNKAYAGFSWGSRRKKQELCGIATGNWGCGVYRGNVELKSILQLMAAAESNRDLAYFTFGNETLRDSMHSIHEFLVDNDITIGKIYQLLRQYDQFELYNYTTVYEYLRNAAINDYDPEKAKETSNKIATAVKPFGRPVLAKTKLSSCFRPRKMADEKTLPMDRASTSRSPVENNVIELKQNSPQDDQMTRNFKQIEAQKLSIMYSVPDRLETNSDDSLDSDTSTKRKQTEESASSANKSSYENELSENNESFDFDQFRRIKRKCVDVSNNDVKKNHTDRVTQSEDEDSNDVIAVEKPPKPITPSGSRSTPLKGLVFKRKIVTKTTKSGDKQQSKISDYFLRS